MGIEVGAALLGSAVIGGLTSNQAAGVQASAADRAAELQRQVADQQIALQREQFNRQVELQTPFREAGMRALPELEAASRYTPFGMDQFQQDPGYGFRLAEGQKALDRQAAARGGLISGGALKAATRYGQEMGSQEYTNAFNRYQTERQARLNPLQSLAGVGQTAVGQLGSAGQAMTAGSTGALGAYGAGASEAMGAAAQARASGYLGGANALSQGLGQYINYNQGQQRNALFQQMLNKPSGGGGGAAAVGYSDPYARFSYGSDA
jgi:hypothetical protein